MKGEVSMPDWGTEKQKLKGWKKDVAEVKAKRKKRKKRKGKVEAKAQPVKQEISQRDVLDCMQARSYSRHRGAIRQR